MVTLCFKLSDAGVVEVEIDRPVPLETLLHRYVDENEIDPGGFIAIRNGTVITGKTLINDEDRVEIFPALSGG